MRYWRLLYSHTPRIRDAAGRVRRGSIASLERVRLGGIEQTVLLRGHDATRPVLLFLHGGPGGTAMPLAHEFTSRLEEHFVVVHWDQRGAGKSYAADIPAESMTVAQFVQDCRELVQHLTHRFQQAKVYLVGHSWGTQLGILAASRYPELFHAYVGVAQVVNVRQAEAISWQFALAGARAARDGVTEARLSRMHPPAYDGRVEDLLFERACVSRYGGSYVDPARDQALFRKYFQSPEYSLLDLRKLKKGSHWSLSLMWRQVVDWDLPQQVPALAVPAYFLHGRSDRVTPTELVRDYVDSLAAPRKKLVWFERSAHCLPFEEPERFQQVLVEELLQPLDDPATRNRSPHAR